MKLLVLLALPLFAQSPDQALISKYCAGCHNDKTKSGEFSFDKLNVSAMHENAREWERVIRKVRAGMMPPAGMPRPERKELDSFAARIEASVDKVAAQNPTPGRPSLHRLNRTEYANVVRDLLDLDVDVSTLLPADDSSEGFDNVADALAVSPALVERYTSAALKVSKLAVGNMLAAASTITYRSPSDFSQSGHIDGLPLGTTGGMLIKHNFPLDAEYSFKIRARGGLGGIGAAGTPEQDLEITIDGVRMKLSRAATTDIKLPVKAGPHSIGIGLVRHSPGGAGEIWNINIPDSSVQSVAITGPLNASAPGDTPSRRRIFSCKPTQASEEAACRLRTA